MDLPLPVEGLGCGRLVHRLREAEACAAGLFQRIGPGPVQLQDLGAMDETPAGERHQVGLLITPA
jgi:hypothetical protein